MYDIRHSTALLAAMPRHNQPLTYLNTLSSITIYPYFRFLVLDPATVFETWENGTETHGVTHQDCLAAFSVTSLTLWQTPFSIT